MAPPGKGPGGPGGQGRPGGPGGRRGPAGPKVKYMDLYKYSSSYDRLYVMAGIFFSLAAGAVAPTYAIVVGKIVQIFNPAMQLEEK